MDGAPLPLAAGDRRAELLGRDWSPRALSDLDSLPPRRSPHLRSPLPHSHVARHLRRGDDRDAPALPVRTLAATHPGISAAALGDCGSGYDRRNRSRAGVRHLGGTPGVAAESAAGTGAGAVAEPDLCDKARAVR